MEPNKVAGSHMKRWTDHYSFTAEVKQSVVHIRPKKFVVTSNFTIRECYPLPQDHLPLERRFKVHHHEAPTPFVKEPKLSEQRESISADLIPQHEGVLFG